MRLLITVIGAFLLIATAPAAAQCGCYGPNWTSSTWGGENALPVVVPGMVDPYFPQIEALGYRNGYGYSDDRIYGWRGPLTWPYVDRPPPRVWRRHWSWRW